MANKGQESSREEVPDNKEMIPVEQKNHPSVLCKDFSADFKPLFVS
jgi:hypothetical protein